MRAYRGFAAGFRDTCSILLAAAAADANVAVERALRHAIGTCDAAGCALFRVGRGGTVAVSHGAHAAGMRSIAPGAKANALLPWTLGRSLAEGDALLLEKLDDLPPEASVDRTTFEQWSARSVLLVPLLAGGTVRHVIVAWWTSAPPVRLAGLLPHLRLLGETCVHALARAEAEFELEVLRSRVAVGFSLSSIGQSESHPATGRFFRVNRRMCEITGYGEAELLSMTIGDITHPEDRAADRARLESVIRDHAPEYFSRKRYVRKDGTVRWVEVNATVTRDDRDTPISTIALVVDITDRILVEELSGAVRRSLMEREAAFRATFEQAAVGMAQVALDGRFLLVNDCLCEITGYSREELSGRTFQSITFPEDLPLDDDNMRRLLSGEPQTNAVEKRYIRADGQLIWVSIAAALVRDDVSGEPEYFIAAIQDVAARKRAEDALRRSERLLAEAERVAHLGSYEWDARQRRMQLSTEACRVLGVETIEVAEPLAFVHPEDRPILKAAAREAALSVDGHYSAEYRIIRPDGKQRIIADTGLVFFAADGTPLRSVSTVQDVTDRRGAERALKDLQARLWHTERVARAGTITASLAHELNQPLTAILSDAQAALRLLARPEPDLSEIRGILDDIVSADKLAGGIISGVRSLLRQREEHREPVRLAPVLREALQLVKADLNPANVASEIVLDESCAALVNRAQIQQVLLNLVVNAIDAMRDQPAGSRRLRVELRRSDDGTNVVTVTDSGSGMADGGFETAFEAFWTTKTSGLGMGLAVCRTIVEAHEGRISLEPNADGGVTARFTLPAESREPASQPQPSA